jgi:hypothetical protein
VYIPYNVAIDSSLPGEIYEEIFFNFVVGVYLGCMGDI